MERTKFGNLLEKKRLCLERIKKIFKEQGICLDNAQIQLFLAKSQIVDRILNEIKGIDSELAQLGVGPQGNRAISDFGVLEKAIAELAEESRLALIDSDIRLRKMRDEIKSELNGVVSNGQLKAYRPFSVNRAVYLDRRN